MKSKYSKIAGWVGMLMLQGATVPQLVETIITGDANLAPLSMVLMVWIGLALYMWRAVADRDWLYITSNGIGIFFNTLLMAIIIFGGS